MDRTAGVRGRDRRLQPAARARFDRLRSNRSAAAFLGGAGPAAIGAILGASIPLARALSVPWQYAVLAAAAGLLFALRRGPVSTLVLAGAAGVVIALAGGRLPI
jgi:chromate transporter